MKRTLTRLDSIHGRLLNLIAETDDLQFVRRPAENEWSVAEIVYHLALVEARVVNDLEKALAGPPQSIAPLRRLIPISIVASRLVRVKAPKAVQPVNPPPKQNLIDNYNAARARLKKMCETHGRARLRQVVFQHPFFGKISGTAAISMAGYHEVRHYKQIREVLKKLNGT